MQVTSPSGRVYLVQTGVPVQMEVPCKKNWRPLYKQEAPGEAYLRGVYGVSGHPP